MKVLSALNQYAKFIIAAVAAGGTFLETAYPGDKWAPAITAAVGSLLVYFVPNASKPTAAPAAAPPVTPPAAP